MAIGDFPEVLSQAALVWIILVGRLGVSQGRLHVMPSCKGTHICMYTYRHVYMYRYVYTYTYAYVYIYIYIYKERERER